MQEARWQQPAPRYHFSGTGPLRKCTCSHFLLFVWGGLTLAETRASIGKGDDETQPKDQQTSGVATPSPCPLARQDRDVIFRYVQAAAADGGAQGGWRWRRMSAGLMMVDEGCFLTPPAQLLPFNVYIKLWCSYDVSSRLRLYVFICFFSTDYSDTLMGSPVAFIGVVAPVDGWGEATVSVERCTWCYCKIKKYQIKKKKIIDREPITAHKCGEVIGSNCDPVIWLFLPLITVCSSRSLCSVTAVTSSPTEAPACGRADV